MSRFLMASVFCLVSMTGFAQTTPVTIECKPYKLSVFLDSAKMTVERDSGFRTGTYYVDVDYPSRQFSIAIQDFRLIEDSSDSRLNSYWLSTSYQNYSCGQPSKPLH